MEMKKFFADHYDDLTGKLLVAGPVQGEGFFAQSVVYLCAHSPKDGAMGVIVNRRLAQPNLEELLRQLGIAPNPPRQRIGLCVGGPLDPARGFVLHSPDWSAEGSLKVEESAMLTANIAVLKDLAEGCGPRRAIMALGYAAWRPGQLEDEILRGNAWYVASASAELIFGTDYGTKWRQALAMIGLEPMALSSVAGEA